ncbi:two-component system KDP operon response regulator KdpE [Pararhizobium capsulatum DSM 1112]|uniref:Two-component system KDP operon response regulator KdpE n=1 Tax=Pararhizobium capsulatum DSM 1112 TaxID=1121113 RepID=A0ABU0BLY7_9HYPH|nr:response regulator [Pararhizobium capsulatum]MDQ0319258.1 two-component system KDP operon response regulator KdpE [Pararhizobium capsulatum DSM 1112]
MTLARILVVDDEPQIQRFLKPALGAAGYEVVEAATGAEALKAVATTAPDLVILDLGLPDMDGKDVVSSLRGWSDIPILILSARDRESEKIAALDLGADDYIEKPFGIGELTARIRNALRHRGRAETTTPIYQVDGLVIDTVRRLVSRDEQPIRLTPKEHDLLVLLARHAGRVVTHRTLLTSVWGPAHGEDLHYLRVFIGQLRQKIERDPTHPTILRTEPGVGYRFVSDGD